MSPDATVDVDALVDELFALPLEQFVVARTAAAKQVKASGDAVGAARAAVTAARMASAVPKRRTGALLIARVTTRSSARACGTSADGTGGGAITWADSTSRTVRRG